MKKLLAFALILSLLLCALLSNLGNLLGPRFAGKAIGEAEAGFRLGIGQVDMEAVLRYALLMLLAYVGSRFVLEVILKH